MEITKIEVHVVGPEDERYTWSEDIDEVFQSNTIIKIFTNEEIIGEAAVWNATYFEYDKYTAESLKHILPILIGVFSIKKRFFKFSLFDLEIIKESELERSFNFFKSLLLALIISKFKFSFISFKISNRVSYS